MPLPIRTRIEARTLFSVFKLLFFFDMYSLCTRRKYDRRLFILFRAAIVVPISYLVTGQKRTHVSEVHIASFFRVEEISSAKTGRRYHLVGYDAV
jgi:hypothetical protein